MNSKTGLKGRLLYSGEDGGAVVIYDTLEGRLSIDDNSGAVIQTASDSVEWHKHKWYVLPDFFTLNDAITLVQLAKTAGEHFERLDDPIRAVLTLDQIQNNLMRQFRHCIETAPSDWPRSIVNHAKATYYHALAEAAGAYRAWIRAHAGVGGE